MEVKLWEVASLIDDARDLLDRASEKAVEASGYIAPTPFGDCPDSGESGWPAMLELSDKLGALARQVESILPPEIIEAIKAEQQQDDEDEARADAASY